MLSLKSFSIVSFTKSITNIKDSPKPDLPEIAFAGRSNVGKSSLLNSIFNRKNLVKTSSTPGKTQLINYFNVNNQFYCVDLPGYGYAKLPARIKVKWQEMIEKYILENKNLVKVYLLIDSRHDLMKNDEIMIEWLRNFNINYAIILSKIDKIKKNQQLVAINKFADMALIEEQILPFSIKYDKYINTLKSSIIRSLY